MYQGRTAFQTKCNIICQQRHVSMQPKSKLCVPILVDQHENTKPAQQEEHNTIVKQGKQPEQKRNKKGTQ